MAGAKMAVPKKPTPKNVNINTDVNAYVTSAVKKKKVINTGTTSVVTVGTNVVTLGANTITKIEEPSCMQYISDLNLNNAHPVAKFVHQLTPENVTPVERREYIQMYFIEQYIDRLVKYLVDNPSIIDTFNRNVPKTKKIRAENVFDYIKTLSCEQIKQVELLYAALKIRASYRAFLDAGDIYSDPSYI